jgi:hypothetical protein
MVVMRGLVKRDYEWEGAFWRLISILVMTRSLGRFLW